MAISSSSPAPYKPVCRFCSKGCCKCGTNCQFLHPDHQSPVAVKKVAPPAASTVVVKKTAPTSATIKEKAVAPITAGIESETPTKAETTKTSATVGIKEEVIESCSGPFSGLANLQGHKKDITGIVLPTGSDELFTSSSDGSMCIWNCNTGECVASGNLGGEIGCLISLGTRMFTGATHKEPLLFRDPSMAASFPSDESWKYDVFLSFRGKDVRRNFLAHLDSALERGGFRTFKEDKSLTRGKDIGPSLLEGIEHSRIAIVVFSKNYAGSEWCLNELVKILDCRDKLGQMVLPVFFHVDPSDVRNQRGSFGEAFAGHQKVNVDKVEGWKTAPTNAANIAGFDLQSVNGDESELIKKIIEDVWEKVHQTYVRNVVDLFGIDSPVERIISLLRLDSKDVRFIGIYRRPGMGKTTVAKEIRNRISKEFDGNSLLMLDVSAIKKKTVAAITARIKNETPTKAETTKTSATVGIKEEVIESFWGPFSGLANLQGHKKDITGIVLPIGSDELFTSSSDGTMCIWNCNTGECVASGNLGGEIGCLISAGTWVFAGLKNLIKVWNVASNGGREPICLNHSMGQVYSMEADEDLLFAGTQEGSILVWRGSCEANPFKLVASLKGHSKGVLCLAIGRGILYSGAMDHTVRVWDPKSFECLNVMKGHSGYVTSLLCWNVILFSSSLDKTVNAWAYKDGELKVVHSHQEEDGVLTLSGLQQDEETDPTLFCCLKDSSVRLYDIPSFSGKGRICSKKEVKAMKTGPENMFFTGDGTGKVAVWNLSREPSKRAGA